MGLRSPNTVIARRLGAIILVGLVFLACMSDGASRGHLFGAGALRRSLTDTTNRKVFDVIAFGAKPESGKGRQMKELPGGGDPTKPQPDDGGDSDGDHDNDTGMVSFLKTIVAL